MLCFDLNDFEMKFKPNGLTVTIRSLRVRWKSSSDFEEKEAKELQKSSNVGNRRNWTGNRRKSR
jgi:hypothetical protein